MTNKDTGCFLNAQADRVAQSRYLHRDHHISLRLDTQVARHDSKELPGPVFSTEHASRGNAQVEVFLPSNPDCSVWPEESIFEVFKTVSVHHRG